MRYKIIGYEREENNQFFSAVTIYVDANTEELALEKSPYCVKKPFYRIVECDATENIQKSIADSMKKHLEQ